MGIAGMRGPNRRKLLVGGAVALLSGSCSPRGYDIRFRVTLSFLFDGVLREGSNVRVAEVGLNGEGFPPSAIPSYSRVWGEATPVALGDGRYVFGLMAGYDTGVAWPRRANEFSLSQLVARQSDVGIAFDQAGRSRLLDHLSNERVAITVSPRDWPMLGYFEDIRRKETARLLPFDDVGRIFPSLIPLQAVVESTSDRVTRGQVERLLPWFSEHPKSLQGGPFGGPDRPDILNPEDFIRRS